MRGAILACVPARDVVLIAGSEARGAVPALRKAAATVSAGGDHLISETILLRTGDGWRDYDEVAAPSPGPGRSAGPAASAAKPWWKFW